MPINILMPALSPTMEKGNLAKWLKKEGEAVKTGDVIAEIETDKATMEYEFVDDGVMAKIVVPEGTSDVPVNQLIAVLAQEGEDPKAAAAAAGKAVEKTPDVRTSSSPLLPLGEKGLPSKPALPEQPLTPSRRASRKHRALPLPNRQRVGVRALGPTAMAPTAFSPRRWRAASPKTLASTSAGSLDRVRTGASLRATWRRRKKAKACVRPARRPQQPALR